jgi:hypothetical protein
MMHHHASASLEHGIAAPHRQAGGARDSSAIATNPFLAARRDPGGNTPSPPGYAEVPGRLLGSAKFLMWIPARPAVG